MLVDLCEEEVEAVLSVVSHGRQMDHGLPGVVCQPQVEI